MFNYSVTSREAESEKVVPEDIADLFEGLAQLDDGEALAIPFPGDDEDKEKRKTANRIRVYSRLVEGHKVKTKSSGENLLVWLVEWTAEQEEAARARRAERVKADEDKPAK